VTAISLGDVSKYYGRTAALASVSLTIDAGEIVGVIGPNGAGKTTLLRVCAGLLRPTAGRVDRSGPPELTRYFGGERTLPPQVSARRWYALFDPAGASSVTRRRFSVLSRGTRQRLGLAGTLSAANMALVLLDEPWEGLDPDASRWLSDELIHKRGAGVAVVVSSHRIHDLATVCDRCVYLVNGGLADEHVECGNGLPHETQVARLLDAFDRARGPA